MNTQILFRSRPAGEPHESNFRRVQHGLPTPVSGEILCRTIYLSLDPYMRGRMSDAKSYAEPMDFGDVMTGRTVGQVVESHHAAFSAGDFVLGSGGWQNYWISDGSDLREIDPAVAPISSHLGVLGMPGLTAYVGVLDIGQPKPGETVVVSAAAGAVGSVAGQIAKTVGCRVVGIAGSAEKCRVVTEQLGFDACLDYKVESRLQEAVERACPAGVDVYIENVGGAVSDAVFHNLNQGARVPLIGLISQYNERKQHAAGSDLRPILVRRATIRGMIVIDHANRYPDFFRDMSGWLRDGKVKALEHVVDGIDNAIHAFIGLFHGVNVGKLLVKCADDPTRE